jgi:hypothetical protein
MKIRATKQFSSMNTGNISSGDVVDVSAAFGEHLISAGLAEALGKPAAPATTGGNKGRTKKGSK